MTTGGARKVKCVVIPSLSLNGFAIMDFQKKPIIGVTEGLLARLNREQLEAVVAHEMAHILSCDCLTTTIASALGDIYKAMASIRDSRGDPHPLLYILFVLSLMLRTVIEREREYRADAIAVRLARNPLSLAEALYIISRDRRGGLEGESLSSIFIVNPLASRFDEKEGFLSDLFSTHPPVKRRIKILLDMAHRDLKALEEQMKPKERGEAIIPISAPPKERWWTIGEDRKWVGPFSQNELSKIDWFKPDTWVKGEGDERIVPAYEYKNLRMLFKGRARESLSKFLCPYCQVELDEILYEGAPIRRCGCCQGLLVEESKVNSILAREDKGFSEEIKRLAQIEFGKIKLIKKEELRPRFYLCCPICTKKMWRRFYTMAYTIEIDTCTQCHAIWFDNNELELLQYMIEKGVSNIVTPNEN